MMRYPRSLLNFCEYDLAYFAENAIAICDEALKEGELDFDRVTDLRNSLKSAHVYIENNIRTVYDKIVLDCWIDYVCRRDNVGTGTLWNRFMPCNTAFEKAVFVRLCDYRYNRAINEWLNLVRVQDYAKNKVNFIFSADLKSAEEAAARKNYFDLMFSITARELGCRIEELGVTKVFSVGRLPSSPFLYPNISKDVVKNLLADFDYSEDYSDIDNYGGLSDQIAMDAFSYMKSGLAGEYNSYNISRSEMENSNFRVYMPCGMKAVCDLEIDALIESGGWLARCKKCGRYFVRDEDYPEEYCSLFNPGGKTCLEIYEIENPRSIISPQLERSFREITDEMYSRVDDTMSLEEYESWKVYLDALHGKVEKGEIPVEELEDFISYSRSLDISRSNPVREVVRREPEPVRERERVVKPFVPQRIDRSELEAQKPAQPVIEEEYDEPVMQSRTKSFFTSPTVDRQKTKENAPMAHIIRADQSAEMQNSGRSGGFTPFGQTEPIPSTIQKPVTEERYAFSSFDAPQYRQPYREELRRPQTESFAAEQRYTGEEFSKQNQPSAEPAFDFARVSEKLRELREMERKKEEQIAPPVADKAPAEAAPAAADSGFELFGDISYDTGDSLENFGNMFDLERDTPEMPAPKAPVREEPVPEPVKPKVIRKNAAAISAYGKISGTPVVAEGFSRNAPTEPAAQFYTPAEPVADDQPFKDIGSIFDVLERSEDPKPQPQQFVQPAQSVDTEDDDSYFVFDRPKEHKAQERPATEVREPVAYEPAKPEPAQEELPVQKPAKRPQKPEPKPEWERDIPEKVTEENVPSGIWTEERNLFSDTETDEELAMLKEKKRSRSNKTQRLFDAIMREPEDNPNVRRKNTKV